MPESAPILHWFRRDLRLTDNTALQNAAEKAQTVIPCYVLSTWKQHHEWTGNKRQSFLLGCLASLQKNLQSVGSDLILLEGDAVAELVKLAKLTGASAIHFNEDYDPVGREAERRLQEACNRAGIVCRGFCDRVLHHPKEVFTGSGSPYRVYTPFWRNWSQLPKRPPHLKKPELGKIPSLLTTKPIPELDHWGITRPTEPLLKAGERAARERLTHFIESAMVSEYGDKRNFPAQQSTSRLSQDLRFGLLSVREIYERCQRTLADTKAATARNSIETYLKEVAWREFYLSILWHYPEVLEEEFAPEMRGLAWSGDVTLFEAWSQGRTGFPLVDAGMRELLATGLMHNRVRMIVSMFLTKDLHLDWRLGESFFMQHLLDGEIASNNGGWQWSAGTGADAAPYFRIQNPWTQTLRYDPEGAYIRQWVPELRHVPKASLSAPPKTASPIAPDYPLPIVDHSQERDVTLAMFAKHRERHR